MRNASLGTQKVHITVGQTNSPQRLRSFSPLLWSILGAGDRTRTGDILLGRQTLYQLSYSRESDRSIARRLATPPPVRLTTQWSPWLESPIRSKLDSPGRNWRSDPAGQPKPHNINVQCRRQCRRVRVAVGWPARCSSLPFRRRRPAGEGEMPGNPTSTRTSDNRSE